MNIFKLLTDSSLDALSYIAEIKDFDIGETVVREGDQADCFYCVVTGKLKVVKDNPMQHEKMAVLATIKENDVFGESCVFESGLRTASVITETRAVLLRFGRMAFIEFIKYYPKTSLYILIFIIQRLMSRLECTGSELVAGAVPEDANGPSLLKEFFGY